MKDYLANQEYAKAYEAFLSMKGYKDVDEILKTDTNMIEQKRIVLLENILITNFIISLMKKKSLKLLKQR